MCWRTWTSIYLAIWQLTFCYVLTAPFCKRVRLETFCLLLSRYLHEQPPCPSPCSGAASRGRDICPLSLPRFSPLWPRQTRWIRTLCSFHSTKLTKLITLKVNTNWEKLPFWSGIGGVWWSSQTVQNTFSAGAPETGWASDQHTSRRFPSSRYKQKM